MITLIHPSRGRAEQARKTIERWMSMASGARKIQYILSIDITDPKKGDYAGVGFLWNSSLDSMLFLLRDNNSVVEATNHAAKHASGEILIYLSDDFECPQNWDTLIIESVRKLCPKQPEWLLKVDDCLQPFHADVVTIPIMSKALYNRLGYFWHPGYKSMFVDQDLLHTCINNNWLLLDESLKFPHLHYSNDKAPMDETYKASSAHWDSGKAFYHKRKQMKFPL
jgi:hypothetical protein